MSLIVKSKAKAVLLFLSVNAKFSIFNLLTERQLIFFRRGNDPEIFCCLNNSRTKRFLFEQFYIVTFS